MTSIKHIGIIGGGLVGSLLSIYLAKRGYQVSVFERRGDPRKTSADEGRSINLALSNRGIRALEEVGLAEEIKKMAIPMHGRMMHDHEGKLTFQPYGRQGQYINSVSRSGLNGMLISQAEKNNVRFFFHHKCTHVDLAATSAIFHHQQNTRSRAFDILIGADGAFSSVRSAMQVTDRFDYSQRYLEHGYKELEIPSTGNGDFVLEKNALHIWPRESFMMIALPNPGGSFTCTFFFPFEGRDSFSSLSEDEDVLNFFRRTFPDAVKRMPNLLKDFGANPTSSLVTIRCYPWVRNKTMLIGDAAHAMVPFYGQGMNAGFEDCRILSDILEEHEDDWLQALDAFQRRRKKDCDAIAELAFLNFTEMRDKVADPEFLLRKKIEARLHDLFPRKWIPLYSMVTFHDDIPYSDAFRLGKKQEKIMDDVMARPGISDHWQDLNYSDIVGQLD